MPGHGGIRVSHWIPTGLLQHMHKSSSIDGSRKQRARSSVGWTSAREPVVSSMLILLSKQVLERRDTNDLDEDTWWSTSNTRYLNDELAMNSLRIPFSRQRRTDRSLMNSDHGWIWLTHDIRNFFLCSAKLDRSFSSSHSTIIGRGMFPTIKY